MAYCLSVLNFFLDKVKFYDGRQTSWCAGNDVLAEYLDPEPVFFSSFNIQVFGTTKYGKTEVKDQIIEILERYDISTIQVKFCTFMSAR